MAKQWETETYFTDPLRDQSGEWHFVQDHATVTIVPTTSIESDVNFILDSLSLITSDFYTLYLCSAFALFNCILIASISLLSPNMFSWRSQKIACQATILPEYGFFSRAKPSIQRPSFTHKGRNSVSNMINYCVHWIHSHVGMGSVLHAVTPDPVPWTKHITATFRE